MNPVVELSEQSKRDIAQMVIAELIAIGAATPRPAPVLTLAEAMKMAKKNTDESFYAWARKYGPVTCGHAATVVLGSKWRSNVKHESTSCEVNDGAKLPAERLADREESL